MIEVNIKMLDTDRDDRWGIGDSWSDKPFTNMKFNDRVDAILFATRLAYFHHTEVRLDFQDMSGKCNGNGTYINYTDYTPGL